MDDNQKKFFFLHIKKCARTTLRKVLHLYNLYTYTPLAKNPTTFIQSNRKYWNDILNNRRIDKIYNKNLKFYFKL